MPRTERCGFTPALAVAFAVALLAALAVALLLPVAARGQVRTEDIPANPNEHSSGEIVEAPRDFDGRRIEFTGEAVGEALERGDMAWLHVNDDAYYLRNIEEGAPLGGYNTGLAIWLPKREAAEVGFFGDYRHEGDVVTVTGTFNAACAEHGGDMDVHAGSLRVVTRGHRVVDPIHPRKVIAVAILLPLAAAMWWAQRRYERQAPAERASRSASRGGG